MVKSGVAHVCIISHLIKSLLVIGVCRLVFESTRGPSRDSLVFLSDLSVCLSPAPFILLIPVHGAQATENQPYVVDVLSKMQVVKSV